MHTGHMQVEELRWFAAVVEDPNVTGRRLGVALLPGDGIAVADQGASRAIGLAWNPERYRPPAAEAFADYVRRSFRRRPPASRR